MAVLQTAALPLGYRAVCGRSGAWRKGRESNPRSPLGPNRLATGRAEPTCVLSVLDRRRSGGESNSQVVFRRLTDFESAGLSSVPTTPRRGELENRTLDREVVSGFQGRLSHLTRRSPGTRYYPPGFRQIHATVAEATFRSTECLQAARDSNSPRLALEACLRPARRLDIIACVLAWVAFPGFPQSRGTPSEERSR